MQIDDVPLSDAAAGTWQAIEVERALGRDAARPEAMAMQHRLGKLSARERIARLTDPGSFQEVGALMRSPAFGDAAQPEVPGDGVVSAAPTHQRPAAQVPRHLAHLKASPHHHERDNHAR